jgi:4-aminobutyrate aminotransferase-like enzyme
MLFLTKLNVYSSFALAHRLTSSPPQKGCLNLGMLMLTTSIFPSVRFIPPLNISKDELEVGIDIFAQAVATAKAKALSAKK